MKTKRMIMIAVGSVAAVVLLAAAIVLSVLASSWYTVITRWWSGTFTTVQADDDDSRLAAQTAAAVVTTETLAEGAVLLKNGAAADDAAFLPKGTDDLGTIALLGYASYSPTKGGAGSVSQGNSGDATDFYDALESEGGFTVDKTMQEYYRKYGKDNGTTGDMGGGGWGQATGVNDGPLDNTSTEAGAAYAQALETAAANADTAVLVFAREGAEGGDLSQDVSEATNCDEGKHYLEFQKTELDLIAYAVENFDNTIVLINSSHVMELGYLEGTGDNAKYDVDAVMLVGGMGDAGALALPGLITGETNPSGHLADTYAYDLTTNPSYYSATAGAYDNKADYETSYATVKYKATDGSVKELEYEFDNDVDGGVNYYFEGVYVGYRWYETADAEGFWSSDYAKEHWGVSSYDEVVQYPFGYGLSYTSFDWEVESSSFGGVHGDIEVKVSVTNTGDVAGKDVVQLYYSAPYIESENIEKSDKVLGAFVKTDLLDPGETQTYTLEMAVDELASYDYRGYGCYVASAGEYTFTLQTDSHNVKVNSDGSSVEPMTMSHDDTWVYDDEGDADVNYVGKRSSDMTVAKNAFDYASDGDGMIGTYGEDETPWYFVTRSALEETHPLTTLKGYTVHDYETDVEGDAQYDFKVEMSAETVKYVTEETLGGSDIPYDSATGELLCDATYVTDSLIDIETDADYGLTLDDVAGYKEWDDPVWDQLVNQMSVDELALLAENSAYGSPAIESVGKSMATDVDGPSGISSNNLNYYGNTYTTEPVMAATWNTDLLRRIGEAVGREARMGGVNGWYAPGLNIHRTPFNGRCAEYFSEDPLLSGKLAASEISGAQSKGLYVFAKHFVANDTDQDRGGMYTWINEQQLREIQLKAFEYPVKEGGALGIMEAYNRVGTAECSVNYGLNTTVLRREWGFKGACLTDGYDDFIGCDKYEAPDFQLRAGGGQLLFIGYDGSSTNEQAYYRGVSTDSEAGIAMLHDLARRILYRHANSNAMEITRDYTPYWLGILIPLVIILIAGAICCVIFLVVRPVLKARKESGEAN